MVASHSQPLAPRAQKASWSYLQAADNNKDGPKHELNDL